MRIVQKYAASACLLIGALGFNARSARADVTYTYTGNTFNDLRNGATCPPVCSVTGAFDLAQPLAANLSLTLITPVSFSLSSGGYTLTDGEPTDTSLAVGTDSTGAINSWVWVVVGPADNPTVRILTEDTPQLVADDLRAGTEGPPFTGPVLGLIQNDAGTWTTAVPEPASFSLAGAALVVCLLGIIRKRSAVTPFSRP